MSTPDETGKGFPLGPVQMLVVGFTHLEPDATDGRLGGAGGANEHLLADLLDPHASPRGDLSA